MRSTEQARAQIAAANLAAGVQPACDNCGATEASHAVVCFVCQYRWETTHE